jgi:hypothetical protein
MNTFWLLPINADHCTQDKQRQTLPLPLPLPLPLLPLLALHLHALMLTYLDTHPPTLSLGCSSGGGNLFWALASRALENFRQPEADRRLDRPHAVAEEVAWGKTVPFLSGFPMFVPSLSW